MNQSISRLFGVVILLFALLVVWTTRWTVLQATALQKDPLNKLEFFASLKIERGKVLADDGTVLARSVPAPGGTWTRRYPSGSLFAQPLGYFIAKSQRQAGLEQYRTPMLEGRPTGLSSVFGPISGPARVGNDLYTTLDPKAQTLARTLLAGRVGAVVAIVPSTGAVKVMYANPTYDDNTLKGSQFDSAVQGGFPPGSTFKVVTAAAAIDTGRYTPTSTIDGKSPITVSGVPLQNDYNQSFGQVTLTYALTNSINTVFAQVGQNLGRPVMQRYMHRFGFYSAPALDLPAGEVQASGERLGGKLLPPVDTRVDLGRMSIGQDKLLVTPLQMAMVASAVANGGVLMRPRLSIKAVNVDGQTVASYPPTEQSRVMKVSTASELGTMMENVVEEGTGKAANLLGIKVAGKTGTAQVGASGSGLTDPWFIGFAPVQHPKIAVAVVLSHNPGGFGGTVSAPIAAQMIKTLIGEGY